MKGMKPMESLWSCVFVFFVLSTYKLSEVLLVPIYTKPKDFLVSSWILQLHNWWLQLYYFISVLMSENPPRFGLQSFIWCCLLKYFEFELFYISSESNYNLIFNFGIKMVLKGFQHILKIIFKKYDMHLSLLGSLDGKKSLPPYSFFFCLLFHPPFQ